MLLMWFVVNRAGFVDSCVQSCCDRIQQNNQSDYCNNQQSTKEEEILSWSIKLNDPLSQCMTKYCAFTEPTLHNPEWPMDSLQIPHPKIRLDFMLLSPGLIHSMSSSDAPTSSLQLELFGGVDRNNLTDIISDHYPVMASWKHPQSIPYYRHRRL